MANEAKDLPAYVVKARKKWVRCDACQVLFASNTSLKRHSCITQKSAERYLSSEAKIGPGALCGGNTLSKKKRKKRSARQRKGGSAGFPS